MLIKNIVHTTRKISFSIEEDKRWTEEDEKLVAAYLQLHDKEESLNTQGSDLLKKSGEVNKQTEEARIVLKTVTESIASASKLADAFNLLKPNQEIEIINQITEEAKKANDKLAAYQRLMENFANVVKKFSDENSAFSDGLENEELWDIYTDIQLSHFKNYEINSIDIVSFDNDDNSFRGYVSFQQRHNEGILKCCNNAIEAYNKLVQETEKQYGIWEEYLKRYYLICKLSESLFPSPN